MRATSHLHGAPCTCTIDAPMNAQAMNVQALVLDFDGVVADTEPLHLRVFQDVLAGVSVPLSAEDYYAKYLGFDDASVFETVARDAGRPMGAEAVAGLVREKARRFGEALARTDVLFPGAAEAIRRFAGAVPVAVASGALRSEIEAVLARAGLSGLVRTIVAAGEVPRGKPAPDPFAEAVARLGVDPARAVAVEDSVWGLESARAAGLRTVGITTSYPAEALTSADLVLPDLAALTLDALNRIVQA